MSTYAQKMNLQLGEDGSLAHTFDDKDNVVWHPPLEVPPCPEGIDEIVWSWVHLGFRQTSTCFKFSPPGAPPLGLTVFEMTEEQLMALCVELTKQQPEEPGDGKTDRDRAWERDYYNGGPGLDPFAYDSQGNDTGLRMSDFI